MKTLRKTAEEAYLKYANKIINRETWIDVAQNLNVVVGEIGCPTCGATMKGGFVENKCPFCDQPYFK